MMTFRILVTMPNEPPVANGMRFETEDEAKRYGSDLLSRWTAPTGFTVESINDTAALDRINAMDSYEASSDYQRDMED